MTINWPELLQKNLPNVKICRFYDLLEFDYDMSKLYHDLKGYLDERFTNGDITFLDHERIVFLHCDHDFYLDLNFPGLILYNLQIILKELNIPNYFCRIISQLPNYQKYTQLAQKKITYDSAPIGSITSIYSKIATVDLDNIDLNYLEVKKLFSIGSRLSRFHRTFFMSQVFANNLQNFGFINYYNIAAKTDSYPIYSDVSTGTTPCHFLYGIPFTRHNPNILIKNPKNRNILELFQQSINSYSNSNPLDLIKNKASSANYQWTELQNSLIYIGLEAVVNCPEPYHDEISFKGIGAKRPFILFGTPYLLSHLRDLGFKTFGDYWDESYDTIIDLEERVNSIMKLLQSMTNMSLSNLQQLLLDMQPIIEHNFYHLKNILPNNELEKIVTGIKNNGSVYIS